MSNGTLMFAGLFLLLVAVVCLWWRVFLLTEEVARLRQGERHWSFRYGILWKLLKERRLEDNEVAETMEIEAEVQEADRKLSGERCHE